MAASFFSKFDYHGSMSDSSPLFKTSHFIRNLDSKDTIEIIKTMVAGRKRADIILTDPKSSVNHCEFIPGNQELLVKDLGSTNGTQVNGASIGTEPYPLKPSDIISIGDAKFIYVPVKPFSAGVTKEELSSDLGRKKLMVFIIVGVLGLLAMFVAGLIWFQGK